MKTKNEVIEFVKNELAHNNTVVLSTIGNGGAGLTYIQQPDEDFIANLQACKFDGVVTDDKDLTDIKSSKYYEPDWVCYKFISDPYNTSSLSYIVATY